MLQQPLTREEIETSPIRATMRALAYQGEKIAPRENEIAHLRTLLGKGAECGLLVGYKSGGKNYYFLNSDLRLTPKPIVNQDIGTGQVAIDVTVDQRVGEILGDVALLPGLKAASSREMPIPHIENEKRLILWLSWLMTPIKREILSAIAARSRISRPDLRRILGFWADRLAIYEGVSTGILSLDKEKELSFQFSSIDLPAEGGSRSVRWIERPPSFMLSRSYEPLSCIEGGAHAVEGFKRGRISPMQGLARLEQDRKEVIPYKRRRTIGSNFLQLGNIYGTFEIAPKFRNTSSLVLKPSPDRIHLNEGGTPFIWFNETRLEPPMPLPKLPQTGGNLIALRKPSLDNGTKVNLTAGHGSSDHIHRQLEKVERRVSDIQSRSPPVTNNTNNHRDGDLGLPKWTGGTKKPEG